MDPTKATRKFSFDPSAMLLGLAEREADLCSHIVYPLAVMRVGHVTAAVERMLVTRPQLIVHTMNLRDTEIALLRERAQDVGAQLVGIVEGIAEADLAPLLLTAMRAERERAK